MKANQRYSGVLLSLVLCTLISFFQSCNFSGEQKDHTQHFDSVQLAGNAQFDPKHVDKLINFIDSSFAAFPELNKIDIYRRYFWKAGAYYGVTDFAHGLLYIDSAMAVVEDEPEQYKKEYAETFFIKGNLLLNLKEYNKAFEQFYKGKVFVTKYLDSCAYARYSNCLGSVCFIQGKFRHAIQYMNDGYEQLGHCSDGDFGLAFGERQGALDNIGVAYERMGVYDTAIIYYKRALAFIAENERKFPDHKEDIATCTAVIKGNLGGVYVKNNNLKEAETLLKENISLNADNIYMVEDSRLTTMKLAHLYLQQGRFPEALQIIQNIRRVLDTIPNNDEERWNKLAADYYDTIGDVANAYKHFKKYIYLKDSSEAIWKDLPGADFNKTFDHMNQEVQIAALKKEKAYANRFLFAAVVLSLMALLIIYLVWSNYRQSKENLLGQTKLNEQISSQNVTMQKTLNALEHSQQENTKMMRVVAHDLHNPISAMVSLTDLLRDGDYNEEQIEMLEMLATSGDNALKLINSLLHAKPSVEMDRLALDELVAQSAGLMQYKANGKHQQLVLNVTPVTVLGDREKIWRVVNNLIVNAIKFSYEHKNIEIKLVKRDGMALLSVKDEGVGISPEMKGEIFHLFAMEGKKGTSGEESFGLGLSISRQIIDAHGGRIWCESEKGLGTTFFVELKAID